jgi:hypothetical protein
MAGPPDSYPGGVRVISLRGGLPRVLVESKDSAVVPFPSFAVWSKDTHRPPGETSSLRGSHATPSAVRVNSASELLPDSTE